MSPPSVPQENPSPRRATHPPFTRASRTLHLPFPSKFFQEGWFKRLFLSSANLSFNSPARFPATRLTSKLQFRWKIRLGFPRVQKLFSTVPPAPSTRNGSLPASTPSALNRPSQSLLTRAMQSPSRRNRRLLDQAASPVLPQLHLPASVSMPRPASPTFIWPFSQPSRSPSLSTVFRHPMTNPCSRCPPLLFSFPRSLSFIPTLTLGLSRLV